MTNTETSMREMRQILSLFLRSGDFNEQWILFKAYLNTLHSLSDNEKVAKEDFRHDDVLNFALVLRNILHHQPAKLHFGKHYVHPTSTSLNFTQNQEINASIRLSLVILKKTLEDSELQKILGDKSKTQLNILHATLEKMDSQIIILNLMQNIQIYVEQYCIKQGQYRESCDNEPYGYKLVKHNN